MTLLALASRRSPPAALPEPKNVEPEKTVTLPPATENVAPPEPSELPKRDPFPVKIEVPEPAPEEEPPRRETVRPGENMDFPL